MGDVVRFNHFALPGARRAPKIIGSTRSPSRSRCRENNTNNDAGIRPRARQLDTAFTPTSASSAAAADPPIASMTFSTDCSMLEKYPQFVDASSALQTDMELSFNVPKNEGMLDQAQIRQRLADTLEALGKTSAEYQTVMGCSAKQLSMWTTAPKHPRKITVEHAARLCNEYALTLDWVFLGKPRSHIEGEIRAKILEIEQKRANQPQPAPKKKRAAKVNSKNQSEAGLRRLK